jgi:dTMP kinase
VPCFFTFEGIEGSGKSTHARLLAAHLRQAGCDVLETREPGGTPLGEPIRRALLDVEAATVAPLTELLLYCADRAQHVAEVIRPALAAGRTVICDRFSDSTVAYQGYGRGLDLAMIRAVDGYARAGLVPDLTFVFDCPVEEGLARARRRSGGADRIEAAPPAFHRRVREGFRAIATATPERYAMLDSRGALEDVQQTVQSAALARMGRP